MRIMIRDGDDTDPAPVAYVSPPALRADDTKYLSPEVTKEQYWTDTVSILYDRYMDETHLEESEEGFFQGSFEEYLIEKGWDKVPAPDIIIYI